MLDERGYDGVVVDLLEWKTPAPDGRAARRRESHGLRSTRLHDTRRRCDVRASRSPPASRATANPTTSRSRGSRRSGAVVCADPDGTLVELVSEPAPALLVPRDQLHGSRPVDRLLRRRCSASRRGAGSTRHRRTAPRSASPGTTEYEMAYLDDPRGTGAFAIDLLQWKTPPPQGAPSREANRLGPFRLALYTDDIDRDHDALVEQGVRCWSPPGGPRDGPRHPAAARPPLRRPGRHGPGADRTPDLTWMRLSP